MRLPEIERRYRTRTETSLKRSTQDEYWKSFRQFVRYVGQPRFEKLTRRQLGSERGVNLIISFANTVKGPTRNTVIAGVRKVWRKGLKLNWNVESDDLPRIEDSGFHPGPQRSSVEPWVHAWRNEQGIYEKSWFGVELNYGLRLFNQQAALHWSDVVFNEATVEPIGYAVGGIERAFKTPSPLVAAFPPEVQEAMKAWYKVTLDNSPDALIWPRLNGQHEVVCGKGHSKDSLTRMRTRFMKRWNLKPLSGRAMRKFVKAVLNDAQMPEPLKSYWQGHKPSKSDMNAVYGTRPVDETFAAQLDHLPNGPVGVFARLLPTDDGVPVAELKSLFNRMKAGQLDRLEVADAMLKLVRGNALPEYVKS